MNMNNDPFSKLKAIHKDRSETKQEKFITPEGYTGYKFYHPEMGYYEVHIIKWHSIPPMGGQMTS